MEEREKDRDKDHLDSLLKSKIDSSTDRSLTVGQIVGLWFIEKNKEVPSEVVEYIVSSVEERKRELEETFSGWNSNFPQETENKPRRATWYHVIDLLTEALDISQEEVSSQMDKALRNKKIVLGSIEKYFEARTIYLEVKKPKRNQKQQS